MVRNISKLEDEIDALFTLPLAEFTGARNMLAARLKKEGRANDADRVKLLGKPSISAWTVNHLYWEHRDAFDELIATGKRLRPVQKSRSATKAADMRDSLDARREALIQLSDLATELLRNAGHNPTPDTLRRVVTTLEAISAHALLPNGPTPGRLTQDVDPPSFESLASLMARSAAEIDEPLPARKSDARGTAARQKTATPGEVRRIEEFRQAKITAAKASLQDAKKSLTDARARVQSLESAQKKANAKVKEVEKHKRQVESLLEKATAAYDDARLQAETVEAEVREAEQAVDDARQTVEEATKDLESLLRSSPRT
ncbi:MAG TPA: hypothetical protein VHQ94_18120 [Pyrinomonadaceae bacterium]|jgi:hypothetical protein|nr:hypothetical protein [Pyrinomonadaceae bacterium]